VVCSACGLQLISESMTFDGKQYTRSARDLWVVGVRHGAWFGVVCVVIEMKRERSTRGED